MQEDKSRSMNISFPVGAVCLIKQCKSLHVQNPSSRVRRRLKQPRNPLDFIEPQFHCDVRSSLALVLF